MSLRLRLALWYGTLTGLVVLACGLLGYGIHARAHYDELDYMLVGTAEQIAREHAAANAGAAAGDDGHALATMLTVPVSPDVIVRIYDAGGTLVGASPALRAGPALDPRAVPAGTASPAADMLALIAPRLIVVEPGRGGLALAQAETVRWRVYALPIEHDRVGRILVLAAPLDRIDASVAGFRRLILLVALVGTGTTLLVGGLIAGRALRPVATLTETARTIAGRRAFDHRVPAAAGHDELGQLAATFNAMLASLEAAYQAQQRFVSDASHELRAPLTAIQANLDLLRRYPAMPDEDRREAVEEAGRETYRLGRLVADLLALARADAGVAIRRQPVELDRVLLDGLAEARHLAQGQSLRAGAIEPTLVLGDPDRLKQLGLILLDNAIKYTSPDGQITVALVREAAHAVVTVSDTGIGIPADDVPHVFDRFYRADPARGRDPGGTGLGLSIARWIIDQHGGEISLTSAPHAGTTVHCRLPLRAEAARGDRGRRPAS